MENIEVYRCSNCSRVYSEKTFASFKKHVKVCGSKYFRCDECEKDFISLPTLRSHLKKYHTSCSDFVCQSCGKVFKTKFTLNQHTQIHGDSKERGRFDCGYCDKTFAWKSSLSRHLQDHFSSDIKAYACPCGKTFQKYARLYKHRQGCQKDDKQIAKKTNEAPVASPKQENEQYDHTCQFCGAGFVERQQLTNHVDTCDPFQKVENGRKIPTQNEVDMAQEKMNRLMAKYNYRSRRERKTKVTENEKNGAHEKKAMDIELLSDTHGPDGGETKENNNKYKAKENDVGMSNVKTDGSAEILSETGSAEISETRSVEISETRSAELSETNIMVEQQDGNDSCQLVRGKRKRKPKLFTDYETNFSASKIKRGLQEDIEDKVSTKVKGKLAPRNVVRSVKMKKEAGKVSRTSHKYQTSDKQIKGLKNSPECSDTKTVTTEEMTPLKSSSGNSFETKTDTVEKDVETKGDTEAVRGSTSLVGNSFEEDKNTAKSENSNTNRQESTSKPRTVLRVRDFKSKNGEGCNGDQNDAVNEDGRNDIADIDKKNSKSSLMGAASLAYLCTTNDCQQRFSLKKRFIEHKKDVHNEKLEYLCSECLKSFTSFSCLRSHYRMAHLHLHSVNLAYKNTELRLSGDMGKKEKKHPIPLCTKCGKTSLFDISDHACVKTVQLSFFCPYCSACMTTYNKIQEHLKEVHPEKEHSISLSQKYRNLRGKLMEESLLQLVETSTRCEICNQEFESNARLQTHISNIHVSLPFCCGVCRQSYGRKTALKRHMLVHAGTAFVCKFCSKRAYDRVELEAHERVHSGERPHQCDICGNRYCDEKAVKKHIQKMHTAVFTQRYKGTKAAQRLTSHTQGCVCHVCGEISQNPYLLEKHMKSHNNKNGLQCSKCSKVFPTRYQYRQHMKYGHKSCAPKLNLNDIRSQILNVHNTTEVKRSLIELRIVDEGHATGKPFQCAVCRKRFRKVKLLNQHIQSMHIDNRIKNFVCSICERGFPRKSLLDAHLRIHSDSRPYQCRLCGKSYRQLAHVREHLRAHGKSLLACRLCTAVFKTKSTLSNHVLTHCSFLPIKCPVEACKEQFKDISQLIHHGVICFAENGPAKVFVCKSCDMNFEKSADAILHLYLHENEGLFPCEACGVKLDTFKHLYFHKVKFNHFTDTEIQNSKHNFRNTNPSRKHVAQVDWQIDERDLMNQYDFFGETLDKVSTEMVKESSVIEETYGNEAEELILIAEQLTHMATGADHYTEVVIPGRMGAEQQYDNTLETDDEDQSDLTLGSNSTSENLGYSSIVVKNIAYGPEKGDLFVQEAEPGIAEHDAIEDMKGKEFSENLKEMEDEEIKCDSVEMTVPTQTVKIEVSDHIYNLMPESSVTYIDNETEVNTATEHLLSPDNDSDNIRDDLNDILQPTVIEDTVSSDINNSIIQEESERASQMIESISTVQDTHTVAVKNTVTEALVQECHVDIIQENSMEMEDILESLSCDKTDSVVQSAVNVKVVDTQGNEVTVCVINEQGEQEQVTDRQEVLKSVLQTGRYKLQYSFRQIEKAEEGETENIDMVKVTDVFVVSETNATGHSVDVDKKKKHANHIKEGDKKAIQNIRKIKGEFVRNDNEIDDSDELNKYNFMVDLRYYIEKDAITHPHLCPHCPQRFNSVKNLNHHKKTHLSNDKRKYQCSTCGAGFNVPSSLKIHMRTHTGDKPYSCNKCDKTFRQRGHLQVHLRRHEQYYPFKCSLCNSQFIANSNLTMHMKTHHSSTNESTKVYPCKHCNKAFALERLLRIHQMKDHLNKKSQNALLHTCNTLANSNDEINDEKLTIQSRAVKDPNKASAVCDICGYVSKNSYSAKVHRLRHDTSSNVKCVECKRTFPSEILLKEHNRQSHTTGTPCEICGLQFKSKAHLKTHLLRIHKQGEGKYQCERCSEMFISKHSFLRHISGCMKDQVEKMLTTNLEPQMKLSLPIQ